jgi:hypothetical protein
MLAKASSKPKSKPEPLTVTATYRVPAAAEKAFVKLLKAHWPTLRRLKLVGPAKPVILRAAEKAGPVYIEIFDWASMAAVDAAHHAPEVAAIWDGMGRLCRPRAGKPPMEFPHFDRVVFGR